MNNNNFIFGVLEYRFALVMNLQIFGSILTEYE